MGTKLIKSGTERVETSLCSQCGFARDRVYKPSEPEFLRWKAQKMFPPCWRCKTATGCGRACVTKDSGRWGNLACNGCGAFVTRWSFVLAASPEGVSYLSEQEFSTYPAGWRTAYIAIHGSRHDQHWLGYARRWLLTPGESFEDYPNLEMANKALMHFGRPLYDLGELMRSRSPAEWEMHCRLKALKERGAPMPRLAQLVGMVGKSLREIGEEG